MAPKMATKTCKRCEGSRRMPWPSSHDGTAACATCDATGKAVDCPECAGEGTLPGEKGERVPCPVCQGFGQVPASSQVPAAAEGGEE